MRDLLNTNTDNEDENYMEAEMLVSAGFNPDILKTKKSVFNVETQTHDILMPMSNGGFVKIAEAGLDLEATRPGSILLDGKEYGRETPEYQRYYPDPEPQPDVMSTSPSMGEPGKAEAAPVVSEQTRIEDARAYATSLGNPTAQDLLAAGYSPEVTNAVFGNQAQDNMPNEEIRTEPLSTDEIEETIRNGGSVIGEYDPTIRENGRLQLSQFLLRLAEESFVEDLQAQGFTAAQIQKELETETPRLKNESSVLSDMFFGSPNSLGIGVGDFVTAGVMDIQEGSRLFKQGRTSGGLDRSMGALLILAGLAEATGVGMFVGKAIKKSIPTLKAGLSNVGERLNQPGQMPPLGSNLGNVGDVAKVEAPTENKPGIIAFHGSGADFDEFKLEEIGTGEGAQAFGYGLYFTDSEDIAKFYKNSLARSVDIDGKPYIRGNKIYEDLVDPDIRDDLGATSGDLEKSIEDAEKYLQEYIEDNNVEAIKSTANEVEKLKKLRGRVTVNSNSDAKTYKVALAPKPDELIDYDLPLKEQPQILEKLQNVTEIITMNERGTSYDNLTGKELLRLLEDNKAVSSLGKPKSVAEQLNNVGISGIKYKANRGIGNRVFSSKTKNYVIFDDRLISILKKYGIAAPVAVSSMAVKSSDQEDET